jgi:hypothetical protein
MAASTSALYFLGIYPIASACAILRHPGADWGTYLHAVRILVHLAPGALVEGVGWRRFAHDSADRSSIVDFVSMLEAAEARIGVGWAILDRLVVVALILGRECRHID